ARRPCESTPTSRASTSGHRSATTTRSTSTARSSSWRKDTGRRRRHSRVPGGRGRRLGPLAQAEDDDRRDEKDQAVGGREQYRVQRHISQQQPVPDVGECVLRRQESEDHLRRLGADPGQSERQELREEDGREEEEEDDPGVTAGQGDREESHQSSADEGRE